MSDIEYSVITSDVIKSFDCTNTHTPKGGAPIVWRNIHTKTKTTTFICWLLKIAEENLFCFKSVNFSKKNGLWSTYTNDCFHFRTV